jgi:hypothetical protein
VRKNIQRNADKPEEDIGGDEQFVAEARRQSLLIVSSKDEKEVLRWIEAEMDTTGWK